MRKQNFSAESKNSSMKRYWRGNMLNIMELYFPKGIPKGQKFVTLAEVYMLKDGKIDPLSEIAMGLRRGLFTPDQVVNVDYSLNISRKNAAGKRLGITNIYGELTQVLEEGEVDNIAFISADMMQSAKSQAEAVGKIMRVCNTEAKYKAGKDGVVSDGTFKYAPLTCLFVNSGMIHRRCEYLTKLPLEYFKDSYTFRHELRKDTSAAFVWRHERFMGFNAQHVTNATPMQSSLFVKQPHITHKGVDWSAAGKKAWATRLANAA